MEIKWYGQSCFEIISEKATVVIDPYSEEIGLKLPPLTADIVLVSHQHHDHNNVEAVAGKSGGAPKVISNPGEYEVLGVYIHGVQSFHDAAGGKDRGVNTIFVIDIDGVRICHLGDLGGDLSNEDLEAIGEVDVLLVPVGGVFTIDAKKALMVANQIEPKIVVPMHYKIPGLNINLVDLENFNEQFDAVEGEAEYLKVAKSDMTKEEREVVVLKPQGQ